jgi:hypothetical protein
MNDYKVWHRVDGWYRYHGILSLQHLWLALELTGGTLLLLVQLLILVVTVSLLINVQRVAGKCLKYA